MILAIGVSIYLAVRLIYFVYLEIIHVFKYRGKYNTSDPDRPLPADPGKSLIIIILICQDLLITGWATFLTLKVIYLVLEES